MEVDTLSTWLLSDYNLEKCHSVYYGYNLLQSTLDYPPYSKIGDNPKSLWSEFMTLFYISFGVYFVLLKMKIKCIPQILNVEQQ